MDSNSCAGKSSQLRSFVTSNDPNHLRVYRPAVVLTKDGSY